MRRLGTVFGFPVYAQATFLFLIVLYVLPGARSFAGITQGLVDAILVTLSILIHELGHAFAFRAFGERNATIVLWGLGGLTYGRSPGRPWQNIVVSLAGPFAGFVLFMIAFWGKTFFGETPHVGRALDVLLGINLFWTIFNLLPLHPMDGGQAFRTLLVAWKGQEGLKASLVVSIVMGIGIGLLAWKLNQIFIVILAAMMLLRNVGELRGGDAGVPPNPQG
jgi:Zn-dependent protease